MYSFKYLSVPVCFQTNEDPGCHQLGSEQIITRHLCLYQLGRPFPDAHLFGFLDEIVAEIRMRDGDQQFRALPGGFALKLHRTVFRDDVVRAHPRYRNYGSVLQDRRDKGLHSPVRIRLGGGSAQEALSSR